MNKRQKNKAFKKFYKQVGKSLDAYFGQFTAKQVNDAAEWAEKIRKDLPPPPEYKVLWW